MRKYRVVNLKDFDVVREQNEKKFKNTMIRDKETLELYVIYRKIQGEKSNSIVRVNPGNLIKPDRGTYIKIRNKYFVVADYPAIYK